MTEKIRAMQARSPLAAVRKYYGTHNKGDDSAYVYPSGLPRDGYWLVGDLVDDDSNGEPSYPLALPAGIDLCPLTAGTILTGQLARLRWSEVGALPDSTLIWLGGHWLAFGVYATEFGIGYEFSDAIRRCPPITLCGSRQPRYVDIRPPYMLGLPWQTVTFALPEGCECSLSLAQCFAEWPWNFSALPSETRLYYGYHWRSVQEIRKWQVGMNEPSIPFIDLRYPLRVCLTPHVLAGNKISREA